MTRERRSCDADLPQAAGRGASRGLPGPCSDRGLGSGSRRSLLAAALGAGAALLLVAGATAEPALHDAYLDARLAELDLASLPQHGPQAYAVLVDVELVQDSHRSFTWEPVEATHRLFDLWDLPEETSTPVFLALCEHGTPAARFYGLAGLAGSDPWTFARAVRRYGRGKAELNLSLGCIGYSGDEERLVREHVLHGPIPERWRGVWHRTERRGDGPEPWRDLREEFRR